jgi:hypothetical protein
MDYCDTHHTHSHHDTHQASSASLKRTPHDETRAGAALSARHAAERLQACWHGGGLAGAEGLAGVKRQLREAIDEYLTTGEAGEVAQVLKDLAVPHYHHELVKEALEVRSRDLDHDLGG